MHLYELAYQLHLDDTQSQQAPSLRFSMIVSNNLGQIHDISNDTSKHTLCMQHLLSTIMYLVDCQIPSDWDELDGFFGNVSKLILEKKCASAA